MKPADLLLFMVLLFTVIWTSCRTDDDSPFLMGERPINDSIPISHMQAYPLDINSDGTDDIEFFLNSQMSPGGFSQEFFIISQVFDVRFRIHNRFDPDTVCLDTVLRDNIETFDYYTCDDPQKQFRIDTFQLAPLASADTLQTGMYNFSELNHLIIYERDFTQPALPYPNATYNRIERGDLRFKDSGAIVFQYEQAGTNYGVFIQRTNGYYIIDRIVAF